MNPKSQEPMNSDFYPEVFEPLTKHERAIHNHLVMRDHENSHWKFGCLASRAYAEYLEAEVKRLTPKEPDWGDCPDEIPISTAYNWIGLLPKEKRTPYEPRLP